MKAHLHADEHKWELNQEFADKNPYSELKSLLIKLELIN